MQWPFVSRALYHNALKQLAAERRRADVACDALVDERRENRRSERHWSDQFLRKMGSYPQPEKKAAVPAPPLEVGPFTAYDPGELVALEREAERLGLSKDDARNFFMREKDIDVLM